MSTQQFSRCPRCGCQFKWSTDFESEAPEQCEFCERGFSRFTELFAERRSA